VEKEQLRAMFARALDAAGQDGGLAARLVEQRLHLRRPEDAAAQEDYLALDELLWDQLAAEACATLGPQASQTEYLRWIRRRLADELLD
jgi:hypothetical protein